MKTIQLQDDTWKRLSMLKIEHGGTYSDIITYLLEHHSSSVDSVPLSHLHHVLDDMSQIKSFGGKNWYKVCPEELKKRLSTLSTWKMGFKEETE